MESKLKIISFSYNLHKTPFERGPNKAMASPSSLLHHPTLVASSSTCPQPSNLLSAKRPFSPRLCRFHSHQSYARGVVVRSTAADEVVSLVDAVDQNLKLVPSFKLKLLSTVAGLNRGLAANEDDLQAADAAAKELEKAGGLVDLSVDLDKLQGRWKLIYSSAFSSRTLGGSRPGPPTGRLLPITLGQVFQRIDALSKDFDNIVDLELGAPWPLPPIEVTATLAHKFEISGSAKVKIIFEKTTVKTTGNLAQLPPLEIPQLPESLRPSTNRGTGDFEVTYLDADTRITRGDRGELRVFVLA